MVFPAPSVTVTSVGAGVGVGLLPVGEVGGEDDAEGLAVGEVVGVGEDDDDGEVVGEAVGVGVGEVDDGWSIYRLYVPYIDAIIIIPIINAVATRVVLFKGFTS